RFKGASGADSTSKNDPSSKASPELDAFGQHLFEQLYDTFIALGYPPEKAINLANIRALEKRNKNTQ
ncbi:unnamed protein product, partial [marine sediment metagenome]